MGKPAPRGQAIVETTLIIIILLMLVLGVVEYGWVMWVTNAVTSAAREGARVAAVTEDLASNTGDVVTRAQQVLTNAQLTAPATVTINPVSPNRGDMVAVTVQLTYTPITGAPALINLNTFAVRRTTTMRYER